MATEDTLARLDVRIADVRGRYERLRATLGSGTAQAFEIEIAALESLRDRLAATLAA
jgi:hypothetical protein